MATPADSSYRWHDVLVQHYRLSQFKEGLPDAVKAWLNACNVGPIDLSLFSAETKDPVRVLSQTLVEINRHQ